MCTFAKSVVERNIIVIWNIYYYHVPIEYGENNNSSEISNVDDAIDDVWYEYNHQKFPDKKRGKYQNILNTDDDKKLMISRKSSWSLNENFQK